jgi:hypothetical protein
MLAAKIPCRKQRFADVDKASATDAIYGSFELQALELRNHFCNNLQINEYTAYIILKPVV